MLRPQPSKQERNKAQNRKNSASVEHYLMELEKAYGWARSWAVRERLEKGDTTLKEILGR